MPAVTVKNIPEEVHERLKERAALNHRSLNSEIIECLRASVMASRIDAAALLAEARRVRARVKGQLTDAMMREAKETGRP